MDGNTLVHDQKGNKEKEEKDSVIRRTFDGDTMTLVSGCGGGGGALGTPTAFPGFSLLVFIQFSISFPSVFPLSSPLDLPSVFRLFSLHCSSSSFPWWSSGGSSVIVFAL